jgi:hypothetical protein
MWHWPPLECERESREDPERGPLRSRPVSRILSRAAIHLALASGALALRPTWSSAGSVGAPAWPCTGWGLPGRRVTATPVRSYRTFSPLPARTHVRLELGRFVSVALSRGFPRVGFPTTLPCGVRTFLEGPVVSPASPRLLGQPSDSSAGGWAVLAPHTRVQALHTSGEASPPSRVRARPSRIPRSAPRPPPPAWRRGIAGTRRRRPAERSGRPPPAVARG